MSDPERVEFSLTRRQAWQMFSFALLLMALVGPGFIRLPAVGEVVDLRSEWMNYAAAVVVGLVFAAPLKTVLQRGRVALTPDGIEQGETRIPWRDVTGVGQIWYGFARLIAVAVCGGGRRILVAPAGAWWSGGRRLAKDVETVRGFARRYGGRVDQPVPHRHRVAMILAVVGVVAVVPVAVRLAAAPEIITPWQPVATSVPAACEALEHAGLDTVWPAPSREKAQDYRNGGYHLCRWEAADQAAHPRYRVVHLRLVCSEDAWLSSATALAMHGYASDYEHAESPRTLDRLGDEAYIDVDSSSDEVTIVVRVANVSVELEIVRRGATEAETVREAQQLARGVVAQVRVG